ncbi:metallophosphoesterase [Pedobacter lusitanus]|uniref:Metallophosphoesterase n=1 Tax=Pedobacter lusitanus TaxID=1503925 RepID=A0A0D0GIN0_9SPHI|nr:metallophosphoesterase [Pedobacter lusitanus]KIO77122.1 metallophosphoesterase [Pedobacter lusitanus]
MRQFLQKLLTKPIIRLANKCSSRPDQQRVHEALTALLDKIRKSPGKRGLIVDFDKQSKVIVFSDQHKGIRDFADDFAMSEKTYLAALAYYNKENFLYCSLGDSEELWKNKLDAVFKHNREVFELETQFLKRNAFIKIFGNHDLYWDNDPLAGLSLEKFYGQKVKVYEGVVLKMMIQDRPLSILMTHGHQGDLQSDGNWFSKWFVSKLWGPFQAYLRINPNTPAYDTQLKSAHNAMMYSWAAKQSDLVLITGHTHQPVFNSLTHLERMYIRLEAARKNNDLEVVKQIEGEFMTGKISGEVSPRLDYSKNTYFNAGCCCFSDGDITGMELEDGKIKLIKWKSDTSGFVKRVVLEENELENLIG